MLMYCMNVRTTQAKKTQGMATNRLVVVAPEIAKFIILIT